MNLLDQPGWTLSGEATLAGGQYALTINGPYAAQDNGVMQFDAGAGDTIQGTFAYNITNGDGGTSGNDIDLIVGTEATQWYAGTVYATVRLFTWGVDTDPKAGSAPVNVTLPAGPVYVFARTGGYDDIGTVSIAAVLPPPVVGPNSITVDQGTIDNPVPPIELEGDLDSISIASQPAHGVAEVAGLAMQYTPATNYYGPDSFTYTGTNENGTSAPATVSVTVVRVISYNCACDDEYDARTMADMRSMVMAGLGFIDPISDGPSKTLAQLRAEIIEQLGLADPLGAALTRTLAQVRLEVLREMGYASQIAGLEQGTLDLATSFVNEAQQVAWRRLEMDNGGEAAPSILTADADPVVIDHLLVQELAVSLAKAHIGHADAKAHADLAERYLADTAARRPPGLTSLVDGALKQARAAVARRYEMGLSGAYTLAPFEDDDDQTVIDYYPVQTLAVATIKAKVGHGDAKPLMEEYERYLQGVALRTPPNARAVVTQALTMAQEQAYRMYDVFRTERFFEWPMEQGVRFYDLAENADECTKKFDPRKVSWVGISQADGMWVPLRCGIKPEMYGFGSESIPSRYEIRQCIEVWPAPSDESWTLRIKAHFGLQPFTEDAHTTTIDWQAVYLLALANSKATFRQADANVAGQQFKQYLYDLTAGSHHTRRYRHGSHNLLPEPEPVWTASGWPE